MIAITFGTAFNSYHFHVNFYLHASHVVIPSILIKCFSHCLSHVTISLSHSHANNASNDLIIY